MTDKDLIGYCEIHCHAPRPLFQGAHINRMIALAGYPDNFVKEVPADVFMELDSEQIMPLVHLARQLNNVVTRLDS